MSEKIGGDKPADGAPAPGRESKAQTDREARLAAALRANLRKRKAAQRSRD